MNYGNIALWERKRRGLVIVLVLTEEDRVGTLVPCTVPTPWTTVIRPGYNGIV